MALAPFIWGEGGQALTPEQVARKRELAELAASRAGDTSPVGHWTQGAARVVDALGGVLNERRADKAETAGMASADDFIANDPVLASLINGTGSGVSMGVPSGAAPAPSMGVSDLELRGPAPDLSGVNAGGLERRERSPDMSGVDLASGIIQTAEAIGADPLDLATAISYETAGTFDPTKAGPTTQWGQHRGLIQFGEPQAQQYGVDFSSPDAALASQLGADGAIAKYFTSSGFKPGMSGLDLYSTINAGAPGKYNASDANNGGAPGSVADKWQNQMADHRAKAAALLGGSYTPRQGGSGGFGGGMSQQGNSGVISALASGMADPWVAKKYGPVLQALMGQQMKRGDMQYQQQMQQSDPAYQLGLQKAQLELEQMRNPAAPKPIEVGGVLLDPNTYQPIFDSRQQGESGFTLSPGQQRFDAQGNPIASGAPEPGWTDLTPEQVAQMGLEPGPWQRGPNNELKRAGGAGVTVNNNMGGDKFAEEFAKLDAGALGTISESGMAAQRNLGRIDQLEGLLSQSPTGLKGVATQVAGEWGINTDGLSEVQAAQALINSMVPEQRQPGSGPMSDADLALFKQSLPRIINQPGGNEMIVQTMRGIAQYDAEGAAIVQRLRAGEIDRATAFAELQGRQNPLKGFKAPRDAEAGGTMGAGIPPAPEGFDPERWPQVWDAMPEEDKRLWQ